MPRKSTEHGSTAVWPEMTVTFFVSTLNRGSSPETEQHTTRLKIKEANKQASEGTGLDLIRSSGASSLAARY